MLNFAEIINKGNNNGKLIILINAKLPCDLLEILPIKDNNDPIPIDNPKRLIQNNPKLAIKDPLNKTNKNNKRNANTRFNITL